MKEYRVKVTVRNNLLLSAIENAGYKSQTEFAKASGLKPQEVSDMIAMRLPPIGMNGNFCYVAIAIMEALGAAPTDLWTSEQMTIKLRRNTIEKELSKEAILEAIQNESGALLGVVSPEEIIQQNQKRKVIEETVNTLTPTEIKVLNMRYGLHDGKEKTLEEVGKEFHFTRERIRQIEAKALRKMRHPSRANKLAVFLGEE